MNDIPVIAYIGLGGNVGDVLANMASALQFIDRDGRTSLLQVSPVYKTPPWGIEDQDWFLNCCASVETSLTAKELLELCLNAESGLKRVRSVRWGPRTIDLDVLVYGDLAMKTKNLVIPHPRMHERLFVMQPLSDIAPELILGGKTTGEWVRGFSETPLEHLKLGTGWYQA